MLAASFEFCFVVFAVKFDLCVFRCQMVVLTYLVKPRSSSGFKQLRMLFL